MGEAVLGRGAQTRPMTDQTMRPHRETDPTDDDDLLQDPGRSLWSRLLALLGAVSVLLIGVSSIVAPLLQPSPPAPQPPRQGQVG